MAQEADDRAASAFDIPKDLKQEVRVSDGYSPYMIMITA
ncbi:predicted protein [Sclerotinia sclerotiorum 1980 UF-70]|uniref:Uncharacterized protein n=1 Tax=Sclerotinia sclerotiorum (strain ATCC 18683 / 1980 / Ss-1) TaxID=665079 RepID=A7E9F4_SCLS1|nr:predicted protein [Sclerotinia sclerotiorum 1980 UF-70]EDN97006.1 predicted protein [Sclerotinia sclerotiorum 1980 UF-70]